MKELSIEEKAKAYDEAKLRMSAAYNSNRCTIGFMNEIFPEVAESEDERIKRELIRDIDIAIPIETAQRYIAWIKKQGEHSNFRNAIQIGDKVTRNKDGVLVNLSQLNRVAKKDDKVEPKFKIGDKIKDCNYKGEPVYEIQRIDSQCYICKYIGEENLGDRTIMHFSFNNPYLKLVEQSAAWSEEDKDYYDAIIAKLEVTQEDAALTDNQMNFLKSLKNKIQPKQEWSEEDEATWIEIIKLLNDPSLYEVCHNLREEAIDWLKSLKDRYTWKPSDEQIKVLEFFIPYVTKYNVVLQKSKDTLLSLLTDLKKLKEE